jgi:hypothetical protein
MLPRGYVSIVFCGTRRAAQWQAALRARGIDAHVEETDGADADKGACLVAVPRSRQVAASQLVTDVTQGRVRLGGAAPAIQIVVAILAIVALLGATIALLR